LPMTKQARASAMACATLSDDPLRPVEEDPVRFFVAPDEKEGESKERRRGSVVDKDV